MSLIHGSRGIIYFVHQFKPVFREASIFEDAPLLKAMTDVNKQITELAPILNSPEVPLKVALKSEGSATAALEGCASLYTLAAADGPPPPYSGATLDVNIVATRMTGDTGTCGLRYCERLWWLYYPAALGDFPLSSVADTLLLPYTLQNDPGGDPQRQVNAQAP